jgi:hypothetical protein
MTERFITTAVALIAAALAVSPPGVSGEAPDSGGVEPDTALAAQGTAADSVDTSAGSAGVEPGRRVRTPAPVRKLPFEVGEKLTFSVRYEFVKAGEATIAVEDLIEYQGRRAYRFSTVAKSTMPFSLIFEVEDRVEALLDAERMHSLRYEKSIKEGHYEKNEVVLFDQERHVAVYPGGKEVPLEPDALDVLSSLYYVRLMDLEVGRSVYIDNHADEKNYALEIKILREETIRVPAGEFDCYVAEPILKAAGIFQHKGRLAVWLAKDLNNIPVKMESQIIIGAIKALLIRMDLGRGESHG